MMQAMTMMKTDKRYGDDDGDNFDYGYMMAIPWQLWREERKERCQERCCRRDDLS